MQRGNSGLSRRSPIRIAFALIALAAVVLILSDAQASERTRTGPNGSVTKSYDPETGLVIDRSGVNGGSSSATVNCSRSGRVNCSRDYSVTGANGETFSGQRNSQYGLFRGRSVNTVTGPDGNTVSRHRPAYRYNRVNRRRLGHW